MKTREDILNEVLGINKERERLQDEINDLYDEAKKIQDAEDDKEYLRHSGYLSCIESYFQINYSK